MDNKKKYEKPALKTHAVKLGVFGSYGGNDIPGVDPRPGKFETNYNFIIE